MPSTTFRNLQPFGVEVENHLSPQDYRRLALEHGLVVVRNFHTPSLVDFAASLSEQSGGLQEKLLHWDFGPMMTMEFDPRAKNYLFSEEEVPFHWDGAFHKEPLFLLFHCEASEAQGGETLFCHTPSIFNRLSTEQKQKASAVVLEFQTEKLAHYGGQISVPLLQEHPVTHSAILRYADEVRTSLNPVKRTARFDSDGLVERIADDLERFTYAHSWRPGDLVLADNYALIHGRRKLATNKARKFHRLQIL